MVVLSPQAQSHTSAEAALEALELVRARTNALIAPIGDRDLERSPSPLMSPPVWDLGHIAAYEDLWISHRFGGRPLLRPELARVYDAFETPRSQRSRMWLLGREESEEYMRAVRARTVEVIDRDGVADGQIVEMVMQHECQHNETMLQTIELARLRDLAVPSPGTMSAVTAAHSGLELVEIPAGPFLLGAPSSRFSYDNERPRCLIEVDAFGIGRTAVTNGDWLEFVCAGGYWDRQWWSRQGWAWVQLEQLEHPGGWRAIGGELEEWRLDHWEPLDPRKPVVHISWFEADAFARVHGLRLPTEAEWEKAAVWDPHSGQTRDWPWADGRLGPEHANLVESGIRGTAPVGALPAGASTCGALGMIGDVWEWTASDFRGYSGFVAHPYREYSEVFFGPDYKVLRGGSWATSARVATPTFRNWDHPQRRQIFAGLRLAGDSC
jgi:gamma-glutamyl hercynylcysteine S-oxide synthase